MNWIDLIKTAGEVFFWLCVLFSCYVTIMSARPHRDSNTLTTFDKIFLYPILGAGYILDALFNIPYSIFLLSFDGWKNGELLISPHAKRLASLPRDCKGYDRFRRYVSRALLKRLSKWDSSGGHNVPKDNS